MSRVRWSIHPALLLAVCWALLASGDAAAGERAAPNAKPKPVAASPTVAMYDRLDQPTELEFDGESLEQVVTFLSDYHDVPVVIDQTGLSDVGIEPSEPVTAFLSGLSLRAASDAILSQFDLQLIPREGYLQLTNTDHAESRLFVRVLDVTDLIEAGQSGIRQSGPQSPGGFGRSAPKGSTAVETVIGLIENGTEPSAWQNFGGEGTTEVVETSDQTLLMIRASNRTHHEVDVLLATLRAAITTPKTKPPKSKPPGQNSESTEDAAPDKD